MTLYRIIDKNGLFIRDDFTFDPLTEIGLDVEPAQGFILPKWDGEKWVEGGQPLPLDTTPTPLTVEERLEQVETDTNAIIDIIAYEMGVAV